jgi:cell division protein FtsB
MREFKKHRGKKEELTRFVVRGLGVLLLLCITIFLMHAAWGMYVKMTVASEGQEETEGELARAEAQQQEINGSLRQMNSQRGEETQIRERFGVVKPGEGEIDIVRNQSASTTANEAQESWWQRVWHALFVW